MAQRPHSPLAPLREYSELLQELCECGGQCGIVTFYFKRLCSADHTTDADDGTLGNRKSSGETRSYSIGRRAINGPLADSNNELPGVGATHARTLRPGVDVHS